MKRITISWLAFWFVSVLPVPAQCLADRVYAVEPLISLHRSASEASPIPGTLRHGRWAPVLGRSGQWLEVCLPSGVSGFVRNSQVSDVWILVLKAERRLLLMKGKRVLMQARVGLGFSPGGDKNRQGDGRTPEGRFYICEIIRHPQPRETYGPVSLRIAYPNREDARRGLLQKQINRNQYTRIVQAVHAGRMPPQHTSLGGSIKIHGGTPGSSSDWTLGCIALDNDDLKEVFASIPGRLTLVEIYSDRAQRERLNQENYTNRRTAEESARLLARGCRYTQAATAIIPLSYPMGDIHRSMGVCTDVVIRVLRGLNIDLQALLYEDILIHPRRYPGISRPNTHIDHRRTRNLKHFFDHHALVLTTNPPDRAPDQWQAGDIVLMDTGIVNGTIYDHIGIVSRRRGTGNIPLVLNLWTVGSALNEMDLLRGDYPKIVGHYRLLHPLYYGAL